MREILFRGKSKDNGVWVEGYYCGKVNKTIFSPAEDSAQIVDKDLYWHEVIPETVGQYTGLTDKNGKKIFEGDIIKAYFRPQNFKNLPYAIGSVIFENGTFKVVVHVSKNSIEYKVFEKEDIIAYSIEHNFLGRGYVLEVIGNIYDNPELLKGEGE